MEQLLLEKEFIKELENQEAHYWSEYYLCCSNTLFEHLGVAMNIVNGAVCCALNKTDRLAFNRTIGIGLDYAITEEQIQEIIKFYKQVGVKRFMIQVSPAAMPENNNEMFLQNGFILHNYWAKFFKKIETKINIPETEFKIEHVQLNEIETFENVIKKSFLFDNDSNLLFSRTYKRAGWFHYFAKEGNKAAAAASLFICGDFASLAIGGTLPEARGKGAQNVLIAKRINDAYDAGCRYVVVETAQDTPENPSPSFRNMLRNGFELAYLRPNYVYTF